MSSVELEVRGVAGWASLIGDALRGREVDPARGPIVRAIVLLAVPMVLEMAMESVFALVDIYWVSRLGPAAVAAVGITESLLALVYTMAIGFSIGVTATVARRIGEGDRDGAARATVQAVVLGIVVAAVIALVGGPNARALLGLMGADEAVQSAGAGYASIMLACNASVLLLFMLNAAFRGAGEAAVAMRVLCIANGINLVLDPLLIFGVGPFPELGVTGAAVATVTGRSIGVLLQLVILLRLDAKLRVRREHLRVLPGVMLRMVRLSGTGMLQVFIGTASWMFVMRLLAGFGSDAVAGYTVAIRIVLFALLPAYGLANAAATMVGQSLGAGDPRRAERSVWIAARMNLWFLGSVAVLLVIFAEPIVAVFGGEIEGSSGAVTGLRILGTGFVFYAFGMVVTQSFNGAGDAWTPTFLNLACFWAWELPLAWALSQSLGWGPTGVYVAITIAFSTLAVAGTVLFRRGSWKEKTV